ncbi:MAG: MotA/TolQ/ExbB proton channel family protein [Ignavibacteriaceae bacterium]|nr:MotA/TolQ/ExbB proton channel family protein [Ignavibacteriaceae bacterium]
MMNYESYLDLMKGSFTIIILAICSIFALKIVIEKYIVFQGIKEKNINGFSLRVRQSLKDGGTDKGLAALDAESIKWLWFTIKSPLTSVYRYVLQHAHYEKGDLVQGSYTRLDKELAKLERGLVLLATLGAVSPFIGLFGTVVGIIRAFSALSVNEAASYTNVMSGIAEALVSTAAGILVAIPAVMFYNYFIKQIKLSLPMLEESVQETVILVLENKQPVKQ